MTLTNSSQFRKPSSSLSVSFIIFQQSSMFYPNYSATLLRSLMVIFPLPSWSQNSKACFRSYSGSRQSIRADINFLNASLVITPFFSWSLSRKSIIWLICFLSISQPRLFIPQARADASMQPYWKLICTFSSSVEQFEHFRDLLVEGFLYLFKSSGDH